MTAPLAKSMLRQVKEVPALPLLDGRALRAIMRRGGTGTLIAALKYRESLNSGTSPEPELLALQQEKAELTAWIKRANVHNTTAAQYQEKTARLALVANTIPSQAALVEGAQNTRNGADETFEKLFTAYANYVHKYNAESLTKEERERLLAIIRGYVSELL